MKKTPLTHGEATEAIQNRYKIEDEIREARKLALGLDYPLLPSMEGWNDDDALALAQELASLIGQLKQAAFERGLKRSIRQSGEHVRESDFPGDNDPLESTKLPEPFKPPETQETLWTEALHCAILIAQSAPEWVLPESGTFSALEMLFDLAPTEHGPMVRFDYILSKIPQVETENPGNDEKWYGKGLIKAANRLKSEDLRQKVADFLWDDVILFRYLAQAVSLYLKQEDAPSLPWENVRQAKEMIEENLNSQYETRLIE